MTLETKKVIAIIGFIIFATIVGFYDRAVQTITPNVSVISKASILVVPIEGMISSSGTDWNSSIVNLVADQLEQAKNTKSIKAVILRVNSPGGTVGASQEIFQSIKRFKRETNKPVIVSIMDIGASGAYWISMAGDYIFAQPGSIVGSLGVITQTFDLTDVKKKYGIGVRTYKAGEYKDFLNPWREPTKGDEWLINKMLSSIHDQFVKTLMESRGLTEEKVEKVADGRIFSGQDALNVQLVDEVGSFYDAVQYAAEKANISDPEIIYPERGIRDWVQSFRSIKGNLEAIFAGSSYQYIY